MIDTERRPVAGQAKQAKDPDGGKSKESEKKKRSRVKQLLADIKKQVEFWFGDVNLSKDRFIKQLINDSDDGYVDISVLTTFNRMKKLTMDTKLIARALKNSSVVERMFAKCGNVVYVSLPRYHSTNDTKGFAFVEFETEEEAQNAIKLLNNPPEDALRKTGMFPKRDRKGNPFQADDPPPPPPPPPPPEEEKKKQKKKKKKKRKKEEESSAEPVGDTGEEKKKKKKKKLKEEEEEMEEVPVVQEEQQQPSKVKRKRSECEAPEGRARKEEEMKKEAPKLLDKKRRRSQAEEGGGGGGGGEEGGRDVQEEKPAKMRKTSEAQAGGGNDAEPGEGEGGAKMEGEEEVKGDGSLLKAKRKRKKKNKEKLKIGEEVIPLRVLSKSAAWPEKPVAEKQITGPEFTSGVILKITDAKPLPVRQMIKTPEEAQAVLDARAAVHKEHGWTFDLLAAEKPVAEKQITGPEFTSGVILKITDAKPLPVRQMIKDALSKISPVAYVDTLEGDSEGHVRFKTPEEAQAVLDARAAVHKEHGWTFDLLAGDHEQRYWQKILVDRQVKLNRPREKKRGTEKLISKAEKIIMARAKEAHKHIHFQDV
ncbi:hypothetical protein CRUP_014539 [Coryphaenoides rupestris]|nr:hypothetical protein CRUP_014539 [Coryphaenoides rupestris]